MPIVRFPFYHCVALKGGLPSSLSTLAVALPPPLHSHWLQQEAEEANPDNIQRTFWSFMLPTASGAFCWRIFFSSWRSVFFLTLFQNCSHPTPVQHIHALIPQCVSCLEQPWCRTTNFQPEQTLTVSSLQKPDVRSGLGCWLPIPDLLWGCVPGRKYINLSSAVYNLL